MTSQSRRLPPPRCRPRPRRTPGPTASPQPTTETEPPPPPVTRIAIAGGVVEGGLKTIEVTRGDTVRIVVTDVPTTRSTCTATTSRRRRRPASPPVSGSRRTPRASSRSRATWPRTRARTRSSLGSSSRLRDAVLAHGGGLGRSDLPIPEWLFGWAPPWCWWSRSSRWRCCGRSRSSSVSAGGRFPGALGRVLGSRPVEIACGAIGVFLLGVVVWTGLRGHPELDRQLLVRSSSTWSSGSALVPASVLFGDVFRAFNPWRAIGRAVGWMAPKAARGALPAPLTYPERLGHWPAAAGIFAFAALELVVSGGDQPDTVAIATLVYSAITFVAWRSIGSRLVVRRAARRLACTSTSSHGCRRSRRRADRRPAAPAVRAPAASGRCRHGAAARGDDRLGDVRRCSEAPFWTGIAPDIASSSRPSGCRRSARSS